MTPERKMAEDKLWDAVLRVEELEDQYDSAIDEATELKSRLEDAKADVVLARQKAVAIAELEAK